MNRLRDKISVQCSVDQAQARVESYFASMRSSDGVAHMQLRVPATGRDASASLFISREVRIEARRTRDDDNLNDVIRITWQPEGSVVFPVFDGTLVVWGESDPRRSFIELDGTYKAPLGTMGQAFDAIIGHQIAEATAREFLADIKRAVEGANGS